MKNTNIKWVGIGFLMALAAIVLIAAVPALTDFNTNQFSISGNKVSIKSGALLTNAFNNGVPIGTGGGVTFSDLVWTNDTGQIIFDKPVIHPVGRTNILVFTNGSVQMGNYANQFWGDPKIGSIISVGNSDNGENNYEIAFETVDSAGENDSEFDAYGNLGLTELDMSTKYHVGGINQYSFATTALQGNATNLLFGLAWPGFGAYKTLLKPSEVDGSSAYTFDTILNHTTGPLFQVLNAGSPLIYLTPSYIIEGGSGHLITNAVNSGIYGGVNNTIEENADYGATAGGTGNRITTNATSGFIGGGSGNILAGGSYGGMIGGHNNASFGDPANFVAGGSDNYIDINCGWSTILAGDTCSISGNTGSDYIGILPGYKLTTQTPGRFFMYMLGGQRNTNAASDTWTMGENLLNNTAKTWQFGFADSRKTILGDNSNVFQVPISAPTNTAPHTTVAPANLHSVTLGKGWTNDFGVRADLVIAVKYTDAATGDPAFSFTNSVTGEAWTNSVAFGLVATTKDTVVIPDISPGDTGSFTDLSGTGATVTFLTAWWKLK